MTQRNPATYRVHGLLGTVTVCFCFWSVVLHQIAKVISP